MIKKLLPIIPLRWSFLSLATRLEDSLKPTSFLKRIKKDFKNKARTIKRKKDLWNREAKFFRQRLLRRDRGWDDSDIWQLHQHLAQVIYPRLLYFKQTAPFPDDYGLHEDLEKMCAAFYMIGAYDDLDERYDKEIVEEGLWLFYQNYFALWY